MELVYIHKKNIRPEITFLLVYTIVQCPMFLFLFSVSVLSALLKVNKTNFLIHEKFDSEALFDIWQSPTSLPFRGQWNRTILNNRPLLRMETKNAFHGIGAKFDHSLSFANKSLVIQFFVQPEANISCSGAYLKLFSSPNFSPLLMERDDPYLLMFGPDKCGETDKVHFIFQHKNPLTGSYQQKHFIDSPRSNLNATGGLYRLIVNATNKFQISINGKPVAFGNLLSDFIPPVNPPREIDDPDDIKPSDWIDEEYVIVPNSKKPSGWDDKIPEFIPDPEKVDPPVGWLFEEEMLIPDSTARKPEEWDAELMGEWAPPKIENPICREAPGCGPYEPPLIQNPDYVGPWEPPMMRNPEYRGEWRARRIPNPEFYEDVHPHNFEPFTGIAFDLWTVDGGIGFGDLIISDRPDLVERYNRELTVPMDSILTVGSRVSSYQPERFGIWPLFATIAVACFPALILLCFRITRHRRLQAK
jgi:calnexin